MDIWTKHMWTNNIQYRREGNSVTENVFSANDAGNKNLDPYLEPYENHA